MQNARLREKRIVMLSFATLLAAFLIAIIIRQDAMFALQNAFSFAAFVCIFLLFLHIGASLAERKGYPTWLGVAVVFFLNFIGLLILFVVPSRLTPDDGDKP